MPDCVKQGAVLNHGCLSLVMLVFVVEKLAIAAVALKILTSLVSLSMDLSLVLEIQLADFLVKDGWHELKTVLVSCCIDFQISSIVARICYSEVNI